MESADGKPKPNVSVDVVIENWKEDEKLTQHYTSDSQGIVEVTIPPITEYKNYMELKV